MSRKVKIAAIAASLAALAATLFVATAGSRTSPFIPEPALGHITALTHTPLIVTPPTVDRLPGDMQAAPGQTHSLGDVGYVWVKGGNVCALVKNGPAGCFTTFQRPVIAFMTGDASPDNARYVGTFHLAGVAADEVANLTFIGTDGAQFAAPINDNAFSVDLPTGTAISGERVTLQNGTSFNDADSIELPATPPTAPPNSPLNAP